MANAIQQSIQNPLQKILYYMTGGPIASSLGMSPIVPSPQEQAPVQPQAAGNLPSAWEKANQESQQQQLHQMKKPLPKGK